MYPFLLLGRLPYAHKEGTISGITEFFILSQFRRKELVIQRNHNRITIMLGIILTYTIYNFIY